MKKARMEKELYNAFQKTGTTLTEKMYMKLRANLEKAFKTKVPASVSERHNKTPKAELHCEAEAPLRSSPEQPLSPT